MTTSKEMPSDLSATASERRTRSRHRVLKGAIIRFNKGYGALECVVRNFSENGAKLAFGDTTGVPNRFELKVAGEGQTRDAELRWRLPQAVGIAFV